MTTMWNALTHTDRRKEDQERIDREIHAKELKRQRSRISAARRKKELAELRRAHRPRSKKTVWNAAILTAAKMLSEHGDRETAKLIALLVKP